MSHKVTAFSTVCPHPQSLSKFNVVIPGIISSPMVVSAADLPKETYQESAIWVGGQPVYLPVKSQVPGVWSCVLDESILATSRIQIQALLASSIIAPIRTVNTRLINILVMLMDEMTGAVPIHIVQLQDAWIQSQDPIRLDWSKPTEPLKWPLKFRYSTIKVLV